MSERRIVDYTKDAIQPGEAVQPSEFRSVKPLTTWRDRLVGGVTAAAIFGLVASDSIKDEQIDNNIIFLPPTEEAVDTGIITTSPVSQIVNGEELERSIEFHIERSLDGLTDTESRDRVINEYVEIREDYLRYGRYELITDDSKEAIEEIRQERYESVVKGINMLQSFLGRSDIKINTREGLIEIPGSRAFRLDSTTDLVLLDQIIIYSIKDFKENPVDRGERVDDILWLANSGVEFSVRDDALAYARADMGMVNLSRALQKLIELSYPLPKEIEYVNPFGLGRAIGRYIPSRNKIELTVDENTGTGVHEVGHNQADENSLFSQAKYDTQITGVADAVVAQGLVTGTEKFTEEYGETNNKEDYATVYEWYFVRGKEFRDKLKAEYLNQSPEYEFLKRKYEFMKEYFEGEEFLYNGESFNPEVGDVFSVSKPFSAQNGIILRNTPGFEEGPILEGTPIVVVLNDENVRILNSTEEMDNPQTKMKTRMYLIMKESGETGWIDGLLLGDLVEKARFGPQIN